MKTLRAWSALGCGLMTAAGSAGIGAAALAAASSSTAAGRSLSFEERVAAQKAIEQVYWNHRLWPKENRGAKPSLPSVLSDDAIRADGRPSLLPPVASSMLVGRIPA